MKINDKIKKIILGSIFIISFFVFNNIIVFLLSIFGIKLTELPLTIRQIVSIFISLILPILMIIAYRKDLKKDFKNLKTNYRKYIEITVLAYTIGVILMAISNLIKQLGLNLDVANNEQGVRVLISKLPIYMTISTCLVGPFEEEMLFRKIFRDIIDNKYLFIVISGLVFGLLHVIGVSNSLIEMLYFIPYGILGGTFAYIYVKSDNIWIPIFTHMIHNSVLVFIQLMMVM